MTRLHPKENGYLMYRLDEIRQQLKFHKDLACYYYNSTFNNVYKHDYNPNVKIPKVIHYAWFGHGEKPDLLKRCMDTWPKILGDYEFKLWDESNFPFDEYPFAKQAYDLKKYAFTADLARLHCIYNYGGIYMDTDCEVLKSFNDLLDCGAFACYEKPNILSIGTLGAKPYHPWVGEMLLWYYGLNYHTDYAEIASTRIITKAARLKYGIKPCGKKMIMPNDVHIFPREWFCPEPNEDKWIVTDNTYVVHHFSGLW